MNKIAIIGTLDTKGAEFLYLKNRIRQLGCDCCVIDCGVVGPGGFPADYPADGVARRGGSTTAELLAKNAPADALAVMAPPPSWASSSPPAKFRARSPWAAVRGPISA